MTQPGFWDHPEQAQKVVQEKKLCFNVVEPIERLSQVHSDVFFLDAEGHVETGKVDDIIASKGLKQVSDSGALEQLVNQVLAQKAEQVEQYRSADAKRRKKLLGGFMGPIMAASKGQANPGMVSKILQEKLAD